jgi:hypothetical protein
MNRHPDLGPEPSFHPKAISYTQEMWSVPKDAIYSAASALQLALGYMPQIKTDVPQWQKTVEQDIVKMQCALAELRKLGGGV